MATDVWVLPGFLGSALKRQPGSGKNKLIWYNASELSVNGPDNLDLGSDGNEPGPLAEGPLVAAGFADFGVYPPLMQKLNAGPFNARPYSYDWRKSIVRTSREFAAKLLEENKNRDFYVIAHSLGGLVARLAYPLWRAGRHTEQWLRTIYLGVPHGGSYDAVAGLCGYNPTETLAFLVAQSVGLLVRRIRKPFASRMALQDRFDQVIASWPAIYELLPSNQGQWSILDPNINRTMEVRNYTPHNTHVSQSQLDDAFTVRQQLNNLLSQPRPPEVCVTAGPLETKDQVDAPTKFNEVGGYKYTVDGDGVVTDERATLLTVKTLALGGTHQGLPWHATLLNGLENLLHNGIPDNARIADPLPIVPLPLAPKFVLIDNPIAAAKFPDLVIRGDP